MNLRALDKSILYVITYTVHNPTTPAIALPVSSMTKIPKIDGAVTNGQVRADPIGFARSRLTLFGVASSTKRISTW